jgi:hypothetical protein
VSISDDAAGGTLFAGVYDQPGRVAKGSLINKSGHWGGSSPPMIPGSAMYFLQYDWLLKSQASNDYMERGQSLG